MPTIVNVKVNTIQPTTRGQYNMIEFTGYDHTNNKGFKKNVFEDKKNGGRTAVASMLDTLVQDDWVEVTLGDDQYKNVQSIKKISEPAGSNVPAQGGGGDKMAGSAHRGGAGSDKMSKAEWAAKDAKKELGVARSVAVKSAVIACSADGAKVTKAKMEQIEKMSNRFTSFLLNGDFEGKPETPCCPPTTSTKEPGDDDNVGDAPGNPGPEDDDIPF